LIPGLFCSEASLDVRGGVDGKNSPTALGGFRVLQVFVGVAVLQWESEEIWIELDWTRKSPTSWLLFPVPSVGKAHHFGTFFGSGSRVRLSTLFGLKWARRLRKLTAAEPI